MKSNDNTVNIESASPSQKGRYHHGDLRSALIEAGLQALASGSVDAISLRKLAREAGVSATAVYRHFPDKAALLEALCSVGDARLAEAFQRAQASAETGRDGFSAMGRAYVRFALANPALFRLMMTHAQPAKPCDETAERGDSSLGLLEQAIEALADPDLTQQEKDLRGLQAWSLVHGLAMLMLDGRAPADDALIDQVVSASVICS